MIQNRYKNVIFGFTISDYANVDKYLICNDWSVQPNGTILSQYKQHFELHGYNRSSKKNSPSPSDEQKGEQKEKQKDYKIRRQKQKQIVRQKLQSIIDEVISVSRKLFRETYQKALNQLIVDKSLVYYRAKYSVITIVVVKKFSCGFQQIQQLIDKVFNWFYEKCNSMNISLSLANRKMSIYQLGQLRKLQWEIAHQIGEKLAQSQIKRQKVMPNVKTADFVKNKLETITHVIQSRDGILKQISEKVYFKQKISNKYSKNHVNEQIPKQISLIKRFFEVIHLFFKKQDQPRQQKLKRQTSFLDKSIIIAKQMKIRLILFYFCLIVALTLAFMVYFGCFTQNCQF